MEIRSEPSSEYEGWIEHQLFLSHQLVSLCITNPITGDCVDVTTMEGYRRHGYMTFLLKELLKRKRFKFVQVYKDNEPAIALYKKLGFEVEYEYERNGEPILSMVYPD